MFLVNEAIDTESDCINNLQRNFIRRIFYGNYFLRFDNWRIFISENTNSTQTFL